MNKYFQKLAGKPIGHYAKKYGKHITTRLSNHLEGAIIGGALGAAGGYVKAKAEEQKHLYDERRKLKKQLALQKKTSSLNKVAEMVHKEAEAIREAISLSKQAMEPTRNFDELIEDHAGNIQKLHTATSALDNQFNNIPFLGVALYYLKRKFEKTADLEKLNIRDTAQSLIRLAKRQDIVLPQDKADAMVVEALKVYGKNPGHRAGNVLAGALLGLGAGGIGGFLAASRTHNPIPAAIAGGVVGTILGGLGGTAWSDVTLDKNVETYKSRVKDFLKSAAEKREHVRKRLRYSDYDPHATQGTVSAVAGLAGMLGSRVAGESLLGKLKQKGVTTKSTVKKFMKENPQMDVTFSPHKANKGLGIFGPRAHKDPLNPYYAPLKAFGGKKNFINSPVKNLDVAMHELGHAKDMAGKSKMRMLVPRILAPVAGTALTYKMLQNEDTAKYAPAGAILGASPTLLAEAQANRHAYNAILKHQGKGAARKFLKSIVSRNTASYWAVPLAVAAGTYAAGKMMHKNIKHEEKMGRPIPYRNSIEELRKKVDHAIKRG